MRIIIYTGKGGVGKTSVAAATALGAARAGHRTLVLSTDTAHSLGDSLGLPLGPEPLKITENLWAQEIDNLYELERNWGRVRNYLAGVLRSQNVAEIYLEEVINFPGMEELFSLLRILRQYREGGYDVIVVDCAPTGETLRLLNYPQVMSWWLKRIFPVQRKVLKLVRPVAQPVLGMQLPTDDVMNAISELFIELKQLHQLLVDNQHCSVRLVMNPEKMVINESRKSYTYLNLIGLSTDAVVVNKMLPQELEDEYFTTWKVMQEKHYTDIIESFSPLPILKASLFKHEVVGLEALAEMAEAIFDRQDPAQFFYRGFAQSINLDQGQYSLNIKLPFTIKGEVNMVQKGDELSIKVGTYKHNVSLPHALTGRKVTGASLEKGMLKIRFGNSSQAAKP